MSSSSRAEAEPSAGRESAGSGRLEERHNRTVAHGPPAARQDPPLASERAGATTVPVVSEGRPSQIRAIARRLTPSPDVTRELFQLAWPITAAMLGETALGLIDTKLVGGLGAGALGGVGLASTLMYLCYSLTFGGMRGVKVRVAHAIGEGNAHHGFAYARAGALLGAGVGVVVFALCRDVGGLLLRLGADPEIVPYARDFLAAVTLGAPATCALSALIQHRQGTGDSRTPMVVGIVGNAFNALVAWTLIYGRFGLPALGVRGGGYATALTEVLECAVMLAMLARDEQRWRRTDPRPGLGMRAAVREVTELGLPTGLQFTAETLAFTAFTVVLGSIGKEEIAAHQIALNIIRVSFLPGVAVAEAASVLVGRALGARRIPDADAAVKSGLALAIGFMALCGVFFAVGGGVTGRFFSSDPVVVERTRTLLLVAAVFQVLDAVNITLRCALRGAKDVRVVAIIGIVIVWSCLPTSAYLLGKLAGLGALGGWIGFVAETTLSAALLWRRWKRGGWRANYALDAAARS